MHIFEDYVSRGLATPEVAKLCLEAFKNSLSGMANEQRQKEISKTRSGASVLGWLWSSSCSADEVFTYDMKLVTLISEMLIAEGREEALWRWMTKVDTQITITKPGKAPVQAFPQALLLRSIVSSHMSLDISSGIQRALASFVRMMDSCDSPTFRTVKASRLLRPAGMYLTRMIPNLARATSPDSSLGTLFDRLVQSCSIWERSESRAMFKTALLNAHHPIRPGASSTLQLLRYLIRSPDDALIVQDSKERPSLLRLLFDVVDILQAQGHHDDATWVVEFMRNNFSGDLVGTHDEKILASPAARRLVQETSSRDKNSTHEVLDWPTPVPG